jgi:hypothetical protein
VARERAEATALVSISAETPSPETSRTGKTGAALPIAAPPTEIGSSTVQKGSRGVVRLPAVEPPPLSKPAPNLGKQPVWADAIPSSGAAKFSALAADGRPETGQTNEATVRGPIQLENATADELPPPKLPIKDDGELTPIHVTTGQSQSFRLRGWEVSEVDVTQLSIDEERICEGMVSGRSKIVLIGKATGITRLTVRANVHELGNQLSIVREFEIHVTSPEDWIAEDFPAKLAIVNRSIEKAYPDCSVSIHLRTDRLVVQGWCDSKESAERIVNLVRSVFLVHIEDKLKTKQSAGLSANPISPWNPMSISNPGSVPCGPQLNGS